MGPRHSGGLHSIWSVVFTEFCLGGWTGFCCRGDGAKLGPWCRSLLYQTLRSILSAVSVLMCGRMKGEGAKLYRNDRILPATPTLLPIIMLRFLPHICAFLDTIESALGTTGSVDKVFRFFQRNDMKSEYFHIS